MVFITNSGAEITVPEEFTMQNLEEFCRTIYEQGRADAIDDFIKLDKKCIEGDEECRCMYNEMTCVECIAEQLKENNK